jgi:hypothetical protein
MIVPDRNPWEILMTQRNTHIGSLSGNPLTVIVEGLYVTFWQMNAVYAIPPATVSFFIFITSRNWLKF